MTDRTMNNRIIHSAKKLYHGKQHPEKRKRYPTSHYEIIIFCNKYKGIKLISQGLLFISSLNSKRNMICHLFKNVQDN